MTQVRLPQTFTTGRMRVVESGVSPSPSAAVSSASKVRAVDKSADVSTSGMSAIDGSLLGAGAFMIVLISYVGAIF
jgi:hypothetical protein